MKINKNELLKALKADLKAAEVLKNVQDSKIREWRSAYDGRRYGNEVKGRSEIVSRDIKKQSEWQHASIIDPFVSTSEVIRCTPITSEDAESARQNELLLNTQFVRKFDRFNFMTKVAKVLDMEGTAVIQTGWDYEDKEVVSTVEVVVENDLGNLVITTEEATETVVTRNQPTAKVCRNEDVYIDPTCQDDMDKCQFVIYRYESDPSTLKQDGRFKNINRVIEASIDDDYDYRSEDTTNFEFSDKARKKLIVHEYWGNFDMDGSGIVRPIVCAWVGDIIIRLEDNPYPDGKPPFLVVPFNSTPFKLHGEANAEIIGDNQKIKTAILRGIIDNMAQSTNGQVGIPKGVLDPVNKRKFLRGENFEYVGSPNSLWQGSYNSIPGSAFDVLGLMNNDIESLTGVKSFSGGISGNSFGNTATGARGAMDATSVRRMNIVRNIAENLLKPLMRKWMSYNAEFLEDEEVVRVTNEEFVPIRKDDLDGRVDIDISVATAEDNAAKSQELSFLLQTLGPSEDPAIRRGIMADIYELSRMPDKAKLIRDYKPEPDPIQQQLAELEIERKQLENAEIQARITQLLSRAGEDDADKEFKYQRALLEAAKVRNLNSKSDLTDLDFLAKDEGVAQQQKLEVEDFKRKANLDSLAFQQMYGGSNEQLGVVK